MKTLTTGLQKKAIVIGGSLSGLFTANILKSIGWHIDVFERSPADLDSRGGGMVLQPNVVNVFKKVGAEINGSLGVFQKTGWFLPQMATNCSAIMLHKPKHLGA